MARAVGLAIVLLAVFAGPAVAQQTIGQALSFLLTNRSDHDQRLRARRTGRGCHA